MAGHTACMTAPGALPDSGDGVPPPRPDALPHPALWAEGPPGTPAHAFDGKQEDDAEIPPQTRERTLATWGAVGAMVVAAILLGVALVLRSVPLGVVGLVAGVAGAVVAVRAKIMLAVTVGDSPDGHG